MGKEDMELTADQENEMFKNRTEELNSRINVESQIDFNTLNQSSRPKKKTKEEKRKDREEKEIQRQELRKQMKEDILKEIRKTINEKRRENESKKSSRQNQHIQKNENITLETINKLDDKKLRIYDNTRLNRLTRILNVKMSHIVSFLEKHPELGEAPKLNPNSKLNAKQVAVTIEYFKKEQNRSIISTVNKTINEIEKSEEQTTYQENYVFNIHTAELKPEIKVVGKIDLDSLNQSTRSQKKTKEEKQKEREEKEKLHQEQLLQMKETIIKEVHKEVYGSDREEELKEKIEKERLRYEQSQRMKEAMVIDESDKKELLTYDKIRLNTLTRKLNVGMQHIVSFLANHPELGAVPNNTYTMLNEKQVAATIVFLKMNKI